MSSFSTAQVNVEGIPYAVPTAVEYTSPSVVNGFASGLTALVRVFNYGPGNTPENPAPYAQAVTAQDALDVQDQIDYLRDLAQYGMVVDGKTAYITQSMANDLDLLLKSLKAVGITAQGTAVASQAQLQLWRDLAQQSPLLQNVMKAVVDDVATGAHSLQALVELIYVRQGNQVIGDALDKLESALTTTKSALDNLSELQTLHNQISVNSRGNFASAGLLVAGYVDTDGVNNFPIYLNGGMALDRDGGVPVGDILARYTAQVQNAISSFFGPAIVPSAFANMLNIVLYNETTSVALAARKASITLQMKSAGYSTVIFQDRPFPFSTYPGDLVVASGYLVERRFIAVGVKSNFFGMQKKMVGLLAALSGQLSTLSAQTPASVRNNFISRQTSPLGKLSVVYTDLINTLKLQNGSRLTSTTAFFSALPAMSKWVTDNYGLFASASATGAGKYQQNITNAITAFESLNDSQKEDVRNYLFVFEEFYKSASAILTSMSQIIQKLAANISK